MSWQDFACLRTQTLVAGRGAKDDMFELRANAAI